MLRLIGDNDIDRRRYIRTGQLWAALGSSWSCVVSPCCASRLLGGAAAQVGHSRGGCAALWISDLLLDRAGGVPLPQICCQREGLGRRLSLGILSYRRSMEELQERTERTETAALDVATKLRI